MELEAWRGGFEHKILQGKIRLRVRAGGNPGPIHIQKVWNATARDAERSAKQILQADGQPERTQYLPPEQPGSGAANKPGRRSSGEAQDDFAVGFEHGADSKPQRVAC